MKKWICALMVCATLVVLAEDKFAAPVYPVELSKRLPLVSETIAVKINVPDVKRIECQNTRGAAAKIEQKEGCLLSFSEDGFYTLKLFAEDGKELAAQEIPVLSRRVEVAYWWCPPEQKYVTYRQLWPKEGNWRMPGVLNLEWAPGRSSEPDKQDVISQKYIDRMKISDGIFIDEMYLEAGHYEYQEAEVVPSLYAARKAVPDKKIVTWVTNLTEDNAAINQALADCPDLILAEIYLSNPIDYQYIHGELDMAKKLGIEKKTIVGLGLGDRWITSPEMGAEQLRQLKMQCPDTFGVGFFGEFTTPGLSEQLDKSVRELFLMPVIRLGEGGCSITNIGAMTAYHVAYVSEAGRKVLDKPLKPGESVKLPGPKHATKVLSNPGYTVFPENPIK